MAGSVNLFSWNATEARSDPDRLKGLIGHCPDMRLVQYLPGMRQQGGTKTRCMRDGRLHCPVRWACLQRSEARSSTADRSENHTQ